MKRKPAAKSAQSNAIREKLAVKPVDVLKNSVREISAISAPNKAKPPGLQRKGKALVFVSEGTATFGSKVVEDVLTATRKERLGQ